MRAAGPTLAAWREDARRAGGPEQVVQRQQRGAAGEQVDDPNPACGAHEGHRLARPDRVAAEGAAHHEPSPALRSMLRTQPRQVSTHTAMASGTMTSSSRARVTTASMYPAVRRTSSARRRSASAALRSFSPIGYLRMGQAPGRSNAAGATERVGYSGSIDWAGTRTASAASTSAALVTDLSLRAEASSSITASTRWSRSALVGVVALGAASALTNSP